MTPPLAHLFLLLSVKNAIQSTGSHTSLKRISFSHLNDLTMS